MDSEPQVRNKYPSTITENLEFLQNNEQSNVIFEIDGTKLEKYKSFKKKLATFSACVFNFPHLGNSINNQDRNILQHQKLLLGFFESAKKMINPEDGRILLTVFEGEPYNSWNIKKLAKSQGLETLRSGKFEWEAYPGYSHRLTAKEGNTSKPQKQRAARTYAFVLPGFKKKMKTKNIDSDESDID